MHISTILDVAPVAAQPYPFALKHNDFFKQEIKNLLDAGIIYKSMSAWASLIVVMKKHTPEGLPQQFCLCIDDRKLNSLLLAVTPAMGTNKGAFTHFMPLPKLMNYLHHEKEQSTSKHLISTVVTTTSK